MRRLLYFYLCLQNGLSVNSISFKIFFFLIQISSQFPYVNFENLEVNHTHVLYN